MEVLINVYPNEKVSFHVIRAGIVFTEICSDCDDENIVLEYFQRTPVGRGHKWLLPGEAKGRNLSFLEKTPRQCPFFSRDTPPLYCGCVLGAFFKKRIS